MEEKTVLICHRCLIITGAEKDEQHLNSQRIFTMLDTPVPIQTLKLSNIGLGYYLDGRPFREFQVLLANIPPPPPCGQSTVFSDSLCLNQVIDTRWTKKMNNI
jgi:hypothetical protein